MHLGRPLQKSIFLSATNKHNFESQEKKEGAVLFRTPSRHHISFLDRKNVLVTHAYNLRLACNSFRKSSFPYDCLSSFLWANVVDVRANSYNVIALQSVDPGSILSKTCMKSLKRIKSKLIFEMNEDERIGILPTKPNFSLQLLCRQLKIEISGYVAQQRYQFRIDPHFQVMCWA